MGCFNTRYFLSCESHILLFLLVGWKLLFCSFKKNRYLLHTHSFRKEKTIQILEKISTILTVLTSQSRNFIED